MNNAYVDFWLAKLKKNAVLNEMVNEQLTFTEYFALVCLGIVIFVGMAIAIYCFYRQYIQHKNIKNIFRQWQNINQQYLKHHNVSVTIANYNNLLKKNYYGLS